METPDEAKQGRPACEPQVRALLRRVLGQEEGREKETEEQPEGEAEIGAGEEPGFREDLQGAGLDSLNCIALLIELEDWFHIEIPEEKLGIQSVRNIADICRLVEETLGKGEENGRNR